MRRSIRRMAGACLLAGAAAAGCTRRDPGGGPPAEYRGSHAREVRHLLARAPGGRTPADGRTDAGVPPPVRIGRGCLRDGYVASAVQYAWAAESYYRLGDPSAARMAAAARDDLARADRLCLRPPGEDAAPCRTLEIWACPAAPP